MRAARRVEGVKSRSGSFDCGVYFAFAQRTILAQDDIAFRALEITGLLGVVDGFAGDHRPKNFCVAHLFR